MQVNYDAESIRRHADALDDQADRAGIVSVVIWGLIGLFFGAIAFYVLFERYQASAVVLGLGIPLASAFIGGAAGESNALRIRCQAQQLLLSLTIEQNTRKEPKH